LYVVCCTTCQELYLLSQRSRAALANSPCEHRRGGGWICSAPFSSSRVIVSYTLHSLTQASYYCPFVTKKPVHESLVGLYTGDSSTPSKRLLLRSIFRQACSASLRWLERSKGLIGSDQRATMRTARRGVNVQPGRSSWSYHSKARRS